MKKATKAQSIAFTKEAEAMLLEAGITEVETKGGWCLKGTIVTPSGTEFEVSLEEPDSTYCHTVFFRSPSVKVHKQNFHSLYNEPEIALDELRAHLKHLNSTF